MNLTYTRRQIHPFLNIKRLRKKNLLMNFSKYFASISFSIKQLGISSCFNPCFSFWFFIYKHTLKVLVKNYQFYFKTPSLSKCFALLFISNSCSNLNLSSLLNVCSNLSHFPFDLYFGYFTSQYIYYLYIKLQDSP